MSITSTPTGSRVSKSDYTANSVLVADTAGDPQPLTVAEDTLVGRTTGNSTDALTATEVRTLLNIEDGADVTDATNVLAALAAASGDVDVNGQNITNVGTVDGVDVSAISGGPSVAVLTIPGGNGAGNAGDLNSSPQTIISAPGAGSYIEIVSMFAFLDYASAAYDSVAGSLSLRYSGGADDLTALISFGTFAGATADTRLVAGPPSAPWAPLDNTAVVVYTSADWYSAAGDSPITIEAHYFVRDFTPSP